MTFLFIIFLSYLIGCISTIVIFIFLCIRYGFYPPGTVLEHEQYQTFHPILEHDLAKNSTIDTVNYLIQFLFQEMRDTTKIRRYIVKKLHIEFNDIKKTKLGKFFIQDISILSFSVGKECPIFSDIQLERQEQDDRQLIKEVLTKVHFDYKDGFTVTLDITLLFGYKCQLFIKIKRIQANLHLEFRREPYTHWLAVFQDEPLIDFDVRAYLSTRESPQLADIIVQQIRRIIRRKQIWPRYKIRYQPFFLKSKLTESIEILSSTGENLIPGRFKIKIKSCDRLSIPFEIFNSNEYSSLAIFLTININEQLCQDYLQINRQQWHDEQILFSTKFYKFYVKQVTYMNRIEFLITEFDPIPDEIDDKQAFQIALEDKNIFLLEIQGQKVQTLKQINQLIHQNERHIEIRIGMPVLHSVQVRRRKIEDINQSQEQQNSPLIKRKNPSIDKITVIMMNKDLLQKFQAKKTANQQAKAYIEFDQDFEFEVGPNERFVNICLWCKAPLDYDVPNSKKKLILLGYATTSLSDIVSDTRMSFTGETEMTLNFQSAYSDSRTDLERNLAELSTHKNYDKNLIHGFVTIHVQHQSDVDLKKIPEEKRERSNSTEAVIIDDDDELLTSIREEQEISLLSKSSNHIFEDQIFNTGTICSYCHNKIWMKNGRQCRDCLINVHKKCEEKFNIQNICTHESIQSKSSVFEDENANLSTDDTDVRTTTSHLSRKSDSSIRQSLRGFGNKFVSQPSTTSLPESFKYDDSDTNSSPQREKRLIPNQTSSKLVNAASLAYSKIRDFKSKRSAVPDSRKTRLLSDSTINENISEDDLQDIIKKCLSEENIDIQSFENLFHEKAVDHTAVYAKANQFGSELFRDVSLEERKQKLDNEIFRLQQEIDLQGRIRDEMIIEYNNNQTDANTKRKIQEKIANIDEKVQALAALTIFYCSGLRYCFSEMEIKSDNSKTISDNQSKDNDTNNVQLDN